MNLQEAIARAENGDIHVHAEPGLRILLWEWPGNDSEEVLRLRQKCLGKNTFYCGKGGFAWDI